MRTALVEKIDEAQVHALGQIQRALMQEARREAQQHHFALMELEQCPALRCRRLQPRCHPEGRRGASRNWPQGWKARFTTAFDANL